MAKFWRGWLVSLVVTLLTAASLALVSKPAYADVSLSTAGASAQLKSFYGEIELLDDVRVIKLEEYLRLRHSPLLPYARQLVSVADTYQVDWRLVPAISGVESGFGVHIPQDSFNAWGWKNGEYSFESWPNGIEHVTRVIKEKYHDRGLVTPGQMSRVYAPPSRTWAGKVNYFMEELDEVSLPVWEQLAMAW